jgi:S1-C subfamily serine protease
MATPYHYHPDYDPPPGRRHRGPGILSSPLVLVLAVTLGLGLGAVAFWVGSRIVGRGPQPPVTNPDAQPREVVASGPLDADEVENNGVYERCKRSVVSVNIVVQERDRLDLTRAEQKTGAGSGVVWDDDGRIVTNYHVIAEAARYKNVVARVVLSDGTRADATVVGVAPNFDLAVIQLIRVHKKPPKVEVGRSDDLKVGQKVYAIGNPFELPGTLTKGIVSALDRPTSSPTGGVILGCIQHTAPINPGNSGGALLNRFGRLIGINSSIATPSGGNVGIGFAIPADTVNEVVTEIIRTGRVPKPSLGLRLVSPEFTKRYRVPGALVAEVDADGPAAAAGLQGWHGATNPRTGLREPGDLITAINGTVVNGPEDVQKVLSKLNPGEKAVIQYRRGGDERKVEVTVEGV